MADDPLLETAVELAAELVRLNLTRDNNVRIAMLLGQAVGDPGLWTRTCAAVASRVLSSLPARDINLRDLLQFSTLGLELAPETSVPAIAGAHKVLTEFDHADEHVNNTLQAWGSEIGPRASLLAALCNVAADVARYPS